MDPDDMIVVIVGDGEDTNEETYLQQEMPVPLQIKQEPESFEDIDVLQVIETAEKYGEPVCLIEDGYSDAELDTIPNFSDLISREYEEYVDDPNVSYIKQEPEDVYEDDEDYTPESDSDSDYKDEEEKQKLRHSMVSPDQRKSFVEDLKQEYPELKRNKKKLVQTLAEIMRNIKKPPPPKDYFIMNDILFECRKCGSMASVQPAAERHYQEKHGPRYLVCFACGVDFRSTTNLYKHEKRCTAPDAIYVLKARALCLGRKGRSRPFLPKPGEILCRKPIYKKFKCCECPGVFTSRNNLEAHRNLHRGLRPYRCAHCPCAYTSQATLKRHARKHSDEQYICDHCARPFKVKEALITHLNTHLPTPKFGCNVAGCERRFATKNALTYHIRRVHLKLPPACACQLCPRSYPRMSLLRDHMKKQHGLSLMTRKMFLKMLPRLSDSQLAQMKDFVTTDGPIDNLSAIVDIDDL